MRVAITGTPGTGKSALARRLREVGYCVVELNALAARGGLLGPMDRMRHVREVDIAAMGRHIKKAYPRRGLLFLEGHYSHLLPVDRAVVLRCSPQVLRKRLQRRHYPRGKIAENVLSEALDAITVEAVALLGKRRVFEVDTTRRKSEGTAAVVLGLVRTGFRANARLAPGRIDYSGDILRNPDFYTSFTSRSLR